MLRSNSQLASLIADAGLVGTKSMQRRSSEAASDGTLLGGQFDVPSSAAPSLYEFRPQQPQNKRIVHRTSSARAAMPPRSPSAHASTPSPINSSSIPPIYRNTVKATTAAKGTASPGLTGSVITLPPATSVMDGPEPSPYKRSDPVSLQSIQQAWATDPGSAQSLEYSLPRPLADALNAAAAATEGASRILNLNHTQSDESSLSMQLSMENSSLMTLISELRSQLLNQSEQSMNLLTVAARRGEDLSTKLNTVLMERQVERDENAHKLSLMRDKEEEKRRDLELSLSDMRLQFETAKKGYETQIDRLKMELQSFSDKDSGLKGLKAIKAVEDKLEKSESARRTAERKALSFEHDLTLLRSQLETKLRESDNILSQLAAEKASSQQLRMDLDAKVITAAEEGKAQVRKQLQSLEADKKSLSEVKDKLEADLGKRTQTLLAAQADLDALKATVQAQDAKITQLLKDKEQLQEKLDHVSMSAKEGTILGPELDIKSSDGRTQSDRPGQLSTPPRPSSSSKRQAATPPSPQLSSDVAKLQRMLIDVKEEYCSRLVHMEGELQRAETSALTYASQLDRMASGLAARTAILLKSRFSAASSYLPSSSASSVNGDTDCPHSSRMNSSRNLEKSQLTKSILQQMNDKLASENAALLVEVARLQANQVKSKLARGSSDGDPPLTPSSPSVAQDALNMTMKEALLSSRNRSLALVLTPEGWEGSSTTNQALFHQTKNPADLAIDAAEEDLRSRASNLALMAQLRALKIDLHEAGESMHKS